MSLILMALIIFWWAWLPGLVLWILSRKDVFPPNKRNIFRNVGVILTFIPIPLMIIFSTQIALTQEVLSQKREIYTLEESVMDRYGLTNSNVYIRVRNSSNETQYSDISREYKYCQAQLHTMYACKGIKDSKFGQVFQSHDSNGYKLLLKTEQSYMILGINKFDLKVPDYGTTGEPSPAYRAWTQPLLDGLNKKSKVQQIKEIWL